MLLTELLLVILKNNPSKKFNVFNITQPTVESHILCKENFQKFIIIIFFIISTFYIDVFPQCYKHNFLLPGLASLSDMRNLQGISEKNPECPVCDPVLNTLAHHLPFAHCSQGRLH